MGIEILGLLTGVFATSTLVVFMLFKREGAEVQARDEKLKKATAEMGETKANNQSLQITHAQLQEKNTHQETQVQELRMGKDKLLEELNLFRQKLEESQIRESRHQEENKYLKQSIQKHEERFKNIQELLKKDFKDVAQDILSHQSKQFRQTSEEGLGVLLKPLQENINTFQTKVQETYEKETRERQSLKDELKRLHELNQQMSQDANNLVTALKGQSQSQGAWGEVILERLLERSGLVKDLHYKVQESFTTEDQKRLRPDVVLYLPDNKQLVIDSKVTLVDYERHCSAQDPETKEQALKAHLNSVKRHIQDLSTKSYQSLYELNSVDFVLMFIPVEGAFALTALSAEQGESSANLFLDAFEKHVMLVSSSTLLATLRTIESIWRHENQNRYALEIAHKSGQMLDKLSLFVGDLESVGQRITQSQEAYDKALNKLSTGRGNLINRAEQIRSLGAKANKQLPTHLVEKSQEDNPELELITTEVSAAL
ncbi:MAG: DNA recombination protein RmuC [Myxococcota bacterium]|nr:DNA recombination protein RmuC [Myxococcota bacterium]